MGIDGEIVVNAITICFRDGTEDEYCVGVSGVKDIHVQMNDVLIELDNGEVTMYSGFPFILSGRIVKEEGE